MLFRNKYDCRFPDERCLIIYNPFPGRLIPATRCRASSLQVRLEATGSRSKCEDGPSAGRFAWEISGAPSPSSSVTTSIYPHSGASSQNKNCDI